MAARSIEELRDEIRELRRIRGANVHLPDGIREAAIKLAAEHGPEVYAEVGINFQSVQRWERLYPALFAATNRITPTRPRALAKAKKEKIGFVELKAATAEPRGRLWPEGVSGAPGTIELTRPDGWTLRLTGGLAKGLSEDLLTRFAL